MALTAPLREAGGVAHPVRIDTATAPVGTAVLSCQACGSVAALDLDGVGLADDVVAFFAAHPGCCAEVALAG